MTTQGGTALKTRVAGSIDLVPGIFPDAAPCIPGVGAPDYSPMRAHCDWCGMDVEVLASGRCLLGHAVVPESEMEPLAPEPETGPVDLTPRRGRRRRVSKPERPVTAESSPVVAEETRSIRTAPTPPRQEREPREWPPPGPSNGDAPVTPRVPRVSRPWAPVEPDGPSGPIDSSPDPGPAPMINVAAPGLGAPLRIETPPEPIARPADVETALRELLGGPAPATAPGEARVKPSPAPAQSPSVAKRLRLPFRRSERQRPAVERPSDVSPPAPKPETKAPPPGATIQDEPAAAETAPSDIEPVAAPAAVVETEPAPASKKGATKKREPLIDSLAPMPPVKRKASAAKKTTTLAAPPLPAPPPVPPPTPSAAAFGLPTIYSRPRRPRGGPLSPRNTVAWGLAIAAMFSAGIAALILSPSRADDGDNRIRPGLRQIALGAVQDYAVRPDPETETRLRSELTAQGAVPRQLAASTIVDPENGDIVALYQAIVFSSNVVGSQRDLDDFLRLFAEGAGITADAFAERVLGRRTVWSGLLDQGQAIIVFRGPEVVIVITAEVGAAGDELADAILLARSL